ncbi:MAG: DUF1080 domain-containing protein [Eudoraea sp.]|jgi:hypothetical protein|uniref:3-keto-disaccharide hydrolase n=1 Tax=Eudoraea sp. TaxID=1979955 RepID=UPI002615AA97|nr:DUF1080 domain-containing protein [uncultured Eudoraea sp.]
MIKSLTSFWLFGLVLLFNSCGLSNDAEKVIFVKDSNEWFQEGRASWKFDGDLLVGTSLGGSGFAMTNKKYQNFTLSLEFYPDTGINSGIFVRCKNKDISNTDCYEMNIWDFHPDQESRTGSIVTRSKPLVNVETVGKWNSYKITCKSNHIRTWINGELTADIYDDDLSEGYIALQAAEPGIIKFRNVKIKEF